MATPKMSAERFHAVIVHRTPTRLRLRVHSLTDNREVGAALQTALDDIGVFDNVVVRHTTGSVIVEFDDTIDALTALRQHVEVRGIEPTKEFHPAPKPVVQARVLFEKFDRKLDQESGGQLDLRDAAFVALCVAAVVQLGRGNILAPASGLVASALALAMQPRGQRS